MYEGKWKWHKGYLLEKHIEEKTYIKKEGYNSIMKLFNNINKSTMYSHYFKGDYINLLILDQKLISLISISSNT